MDLDALTQNTTEPDAAFITEVTSAVEESDDVKHAKPPKFGMEETLLKLSCVGDCAGAPAMTTTIQIQLLPFYVLALNYLGVIWANRENRKLALNILKSAESAMCLFDYDDPFLITEPLNDGDGRSCIPTCCTFQTVLILSFNGAVPTSSPSSFLSAAVR